MDYVDIKSISSLVSRIGIGEDTGRTMTLELKDNLQLTSIEQQLNDSEALKKRLVASHVYDDRINRPVLQINLRGDDATPQQVINVLVDIDALELTSGELVTINRIASAAVGGRPPQSGAGGKMGRRR